MVSAAVRSDTMSPTVQHLYDVSAKLCCPIAKQQRQAASNVLVQTAERIIFNDTGQPILIIDYCKHFNIFILLKLITLISNL